MTNVPAWRRYLRFWRSDPKRDVDDEVRFHVDSLTDELVARGWPREAARADAARRFGDVPTISHSLYDLSQERERTMRRSEWFDIILQDARYGIRQMLKTPAFTIVAVLTLGLGIGANSAIFSVVYSVLLHPLPYANGDRIVTLWEQIDAHRMGVTYGNYDVWRHEATDFETIGATGGSRPMTLTGQGDPTPIATIRASASYWKTLYIAPVLGSYFGESYDQPGAPHVVVLSYALWQSRFAGDRGVIGRSITLNSVPFTVVAVAPPTYISGPPMERIWTPLAMTAAQIAEHSDHELNVYGVPRPGFTREAALAQLVRIETRLAKEYPNSYFDGGIVSERLIDGLVEDTRLVLYLLLGAVALVLLIACSNIANLLIVRATVRRAEIAIRGALGATRHRIVGQLFVESLLLSLAGGAVGLVIAIAGIRFLVASPMRVPRLQDATLNGPVLAFTLIIAGLSAVLFGLAPALRAAQVDLQQTLRDGGRQSQGAVRERLRGGLIVAELSLAYLLLVSAGLLIRSATLVSEVPTGFNTGNLLLINLALPGTRYGTPATQEAAFARIQAEVAAIPGVTGVARTQVAPIYSGGWDWIAFRPGSNGHDDGSAGADMRAITPGYFKLIGAGPLRGREFDATDRADGQQVAIVSRGLAKRLFGDADPIGKQISNGNAGDPSWREIVGEVEDIHADGQASDPPLILYMPSTQYVNGGQTLMIRGTVPVMGLIPAVRRAVASVDPLLAVSGLTTMDDAIRESHALPRYTTWLLTLLGLVGLVLAVVGVYGVIGYVVSQRTHEFGVRMALGASAPTVRWMVVRQGLVLGVLGVGVGLALSLAATRLLHALLFGITPHDPATYAIVTLLLLLVGALASYLPARRATRIDPLEALRGG